MSHGRGNSDCCVVPKKPPNKAAGEIPAVAEVVEGRRRAKGNAIPAHMSRRSMRVYDMGSARHAIRITTGRSAPQQAATVELAVPAALTARSASQDEYLVWARYPQAGDAVPPHTYLTADVRYIQARDLLRFDLEPAAFTLRPDGQWEAVLVLSTPDVQPEPEADAPAETATANASR